MGHIIPKLNLNKTPQAVDSNSLVFAKNIKVNTDGSLGRDNSIIQAKANGRAIDLSKITGNILNKSTEYLGHIVGVNSCIYLFMKLNDLDDNNEIISSSYKVYEYNEVTEALNVVPCNWTYHGGKITGCVTTNNTNQKILTVSEYDCEDLVPLKHINLSECKQNDDESIYTQNPNIPITNLHLVEYYSTPIPKGVYQFFIRYKVRDGFYTNWFPASKELYAWDNEIVSTIQGTLKYTDTSKDCLLSFVLAVEHLFPEFNSIYKDFQIGFIVSSNNAVVGRSWKSFNLNTNVIYFDYNEAFIEEVLVDDFLKGSLEIYDSKNVIPYKNKLYISNYSENDYNPKLQDVLDSIDVTVGYSYESESGSVNTNYLGDGLLSRTVPYLVYNDAVIYDKIDNTFIRNHVEETDKFSKHVTTNTVTHEHHIPHERYEQLFPDLNGINRPGEKLLVCAIYFNGVDAEGNDVVLRGTGFNQSNLATEFTWLLSSDDYTINENPTRLKSALISLITNSPNYIPNTEANGNKLGRLVSSFNEDYELTNFLKYVLKGIDANRNLYVRATNSEDLFVLTGIDIDCIKVISIDHTVSTGTNYNAKINYTRYSMSVSSGEITTIITEDNHKQINTLLPFCEYDVYIHFVKQNGITTNGYKVKHLDRNDTAIMARNYDSSRPCIIYPIFTINRTIDIGYTACFFTIKQTKYNVSQINKIENYRYNSIDLDALLYSTNNKLDVISLGAGSGWHDNQLNVRDGIYYNSNEHIVSESVYLGNSGVVCTTEFNGSVGFVYHNYDANSNDVTTLIKVTPYIKFEQSEFDDYTKLNIQGFISKVAKLDYDTTNNELFISGFDVFDKGDTDKLDLTEKDTYTPFVATDFYYVYSKYHLNCLALRENLNKGIRTWNQTVNNVDVLKKQYIVSVNSQNCSLIYDLPFMYKEYTRKYYSVVDDKTFTVFDNAVRSSNVDVDEVFRSVYKFDAEDYYNVPTNRGIIINLFSINNEIFVHTEHALFKFTDSSLLKVGDDLYTSNKNVGVSESSPFDIGIAEIVDSQYGHGGLQNKKHSLITFNGYVFYDSLVRNIYSYDNQSGIQDITSPVRKVIDWFEPTDITFVSDDANNRFFITLSKGEGNEKQLICLSYSFISKSFISIHDINYDYAFNSRINTYFIEGSNLLKIDYKDFGSYVNHWRSALSVGDEAISVNNPVGSCIDVIINDGFEVIKYLSHIHWICSNINNYVGENPYNVAEELIAEYGGDDIRVYSDQTWSDLLPIDTKQNTQQINSANSYQYPRYNNGIWTMNYFRDIKNADSNYTSDDMTLIHGKYIVVRFIFGANKKNFKFENLNINFKNYEKV